MSLFLSQLLLRCFKIFCTLWSKGSVQLVRGTPLPSLFPLRLLPCPYCRTSPSQNLWIVRAAKYKFFYLRRRCRVILPRGIVPSMWHTPPWSKNALCVHRFFSYDSTQKFCTSLVHQSCICQYLEGCRTVPQYLSVRGEATKVCIYFLPLLMSSKTVFSLYTYWYTLLSKCVLLKHLGT